MMSGPYFEQLRTRLKGLGLGRVGMKKLKNSHKGVSCECCASFAQHNMLCENFAQGTIHRPKCKIAVLSNGKNSWFLRVGNAG